MIQGIKDLMNSGTTIRPSYVDQEGTRYSLSVYPNVEDKGIGLAIGVWNGPTYSAMPIYLQSQEARELIEALERALAF